MIAFLLSSSLLMLAAGVNGQGYGRQGFGAAGGGENFGSFNPPPSFYGRGYRHHNNFGSFPNNGPNNGGFNNNGGGFDPQTNNNNNNFHGSSSSSSWGSIPNTQFGQNGGFQTPNTQFGQGAQSSNTDFSRSNPRQFESPNQSPPRTEVQPGLPSSSSSTNSQPSETANAEIDTTGARTFGKSSRGDVAVSEAVTGGAGEPASPPTDTAPTLPPPNDGSLAVDLPQGAGSNSDQSGVQTPPIVDPNSSKLIPEPPVLG